MLLTHFEQSTFSFNYVKNSYVGTSMNTHIIHYKQIQPLYASLLSIFSKKLPCNTALCTSGAINSVFGHE